MQSLIQLRKISLALAITQILILPVAQAATITVDDFDDVSADDGNCTLREAILSANTNTAIGGCDSGASGEDHVQFTGVGAGQTIVLTQTPALSIDSGEPLRIFGPGAELLTIDGNKSTRTNAGIFYLLDVSAQFNDLTISNGARYQGGGVYADNATVGLINTVVSGNTATLGNGGGIFAYGSDIFLTNSTVSGNSAIKRWGGGIIANELSTVTLTNSTVSGNVADWGGGIIAHGDSTVILDSSTVSGNSVSHSGGGLIASSGSTANLSNSTVSGNYAHILGGGISVNNSSLSLTNTTVSENIARVGGAGISVRATETNSSSATLSNSVIANSSGPAPESTDCHMSDDGTGTTTSVTADVHNIIADGSCDVPTNLALNVDPTLGPLADNGGPTKTHKLLAGSPAIEAGDDAVCAAGPVNNLDQRGFARPEGAHCDIGAFEFKEYLQGLTIIKDVTNDNSGTALPADFTLHLTGGTLLGSMYDGTEEMKSGDTPDVEAGTPYTLSETALPGYTETGIACTDDVDDVTPVNHPVTLTTGQKVTCTISNDDDLVAPPQLTLIKAVVNNYGGDAAPDDFLPTVDGTVVVSGAPNAYFAGTPLVLNETLLPGYTFASLTGTGCPTELGGTVTLASGDDITCTITNNDVEPQLTLTKVVNGGSAAPDDFSLTVDGDPVLSGVANTYEANTELALDETLLPEYTFTSLTGDLKCPNALGETVTLAPGDDITCTITNTAVAQLTLVKTVVNDNGGDALPDAFLPTVAGAVVISGVKNTFSANTALVLNETQLSGYTFTSLTGDAKCPPALGGTVTLAPGDDITCTITNNDVAPQLTLVKTVVNDNGGNAAPDAFLPTVAGAVVISGAKNLYTANTPLALDETQLPGYTFTSLTGDAKCPAALGGTVTLAPGDDITCEISNNDVQPGLTMLKDVTNNHGGNAVESDFDLHLTGGTLGGTTHDGTEDMKSGDTPPVEANAPYTLSETALLGYAQTGIACTDDVDGVTPVNHPLTLNEGQNVTCTISNSDDPDDSTFYVIPIPDGGASVINL